MQPLAHFGVCRCCGARQTEYLVSEVDVLRSFIFLPSIDGSYTGFIVRYCLIRTSVEQFQVFNQHPCVSVSPTVRHEVIRARRVAAPVDGGSTHRNTLFVHRARRHLHPRAVPGQRQTPVRGVPYGGVRSCTRVMHPRLDLQVHRRITPQPSE